LDDDFDIHCCQKVEDSIILNNELDFEFEYIGSVDLNDWDALSLLIGKKESLENKQAYSQDNINQSGNINFLYCGGTYVYSVSNPGDSDDNDSNLEDEEYDLDKILKDLQDEEEVENEVDEEELDNEEEEEDEEDEDDDFEVEDEEYEDEDFEEEDEDEDDLDQILKEMGDGEEEEEEDEEEEIDDTKVEFEDYTVTKYGFIDKKGNQVIPCIYDSVYSFDDGITRVQQNG
jgi:hypothetical protein